MSLPLGGSDPAWGQVFLASLARAHAEMEDEEAAEQEFARAAEADPTFGPAQNEYAIFLTEREKNLQKAVEIAKRAVASAANNHYYRDTLGWAYYKLGRLEEALVQLQRAKELDENDPEVQYHLGAVQEALGNNAEAKASYEVSLRLLPSFTPSLEALTSLKEKTE